MSAQATVKYESIEQLYQTFRKTLSSTEEDSKINDKINLAKIKDKFKAFFHELKQIISTELEQQ